MRKTILLRFSFRSIYDIIGVGPTPVGVSECIKCRWRDVMLDEKFEVLKDYITRALGSADRKYLLAHMKQLDKNIESLINHVCQRR